MITKEQVEQSYRDYQAQGLVVAEHRRQFRMVVKKHDSLAKIAQNMLEAFRDQQESGDEAARPEAEEYHHPRETGR